MSSKFDIFTLVLKHKNLPYPETVAIAKNEPELNEWYQSQIDSSSNSFIKGTPLENFVVPDKKDESTGVSKFETEQIFIQLLINSKNKPPYFSSLHLIGCPELDKSNN